MRFQLDHLPAYDDSALIDELNRVAALVPDRKMSRAQFDSLARVHSSTIGKRFGTWEAALVAAGISDRFDDSSAAYNKEELLASIRSVAKTLNTTTVTLTQFKAHTGIDGGPVRRVFGSWALALEAAGLSQSTLARRYTDEQCYENLLSLWIHYGRPPHHDEANEAPSEVGSKAYIRRWGTWRKALEAFVVRANDPKGDSVEPKSTPSPEPVAAVRAEATESRGSRDIPLALRYYVLKRDRFRCVTCGKSPANDAGTVLHVDHIHPWSLGGATVADNLRVLCMNCNLGKGASHAEQI